MGYENLPDRDDRPEVVALFANLKAALPKLEELFAEYSGHSWEYEDRIYRFYHGSFKVYWLQNGTTKITEALQALAPDRQLNDDYRQIISEGTGKTWTADHNQRWLKETRPSWRRSSTPGTCSKWRSATARSSSGRLLSYPAGGRRCCTCSTSGEGACALTHPDRMARKTVNRH
jgi:hypothetical protein